MDERGPDSIRFFQHRLPPSALRIRQRALSRRPMARSFGWTDFCVSTPIAIGIYLLARGIYQLLEFVVCVRSGGF